MWAWPSANPKTYRVFFPALPRSISCGPAMKIQRTGSNAQRVHKATTKPSGVEQQHYQRKQNKSVPPKSSHDVPDTSKMSSAELLDFLLATTTQSDDLRNPLYNRLRELQAKELEEDQVDAANTYAAFVKRQQPVQPHDSTV
jgi:hypothetical protein